MRIAVVHNLPAGGARRRLASQMAHLDGDVVELCLETAVPIRRDAVVIPLRRRASSCPRLLRPPLRYLDLRELERAWRRVAGTLVDLNPDVMYLNPCRYLQTPPVVGVGGPPTLYFCDEPRRVDHEALGRSSRNPLTKPLYAPAYARERALDRAAVCRVDAIATNSHFTAREINGAYSRDATVVTMGVPESFRRAPIRERSRFLLSVGALVSTKGHDLVLSAAAMADDRWPVHIVAPRPDPVGEERLRALARQLEVELVIRVGISDDELRTLYCTAAGTLYLAAREPFGLVSLEAQSCGCPVIVAHEGGLPETIIDGVTGWRCPRNASAVSAKIDALADCTVHSRMSEAARKHGSHFTWSRSAEEISRLLDNLRPRAS